MTKLSWVVLILFIGCWAGLVTYGLISGPSPTAPVVAMSPPIPETRPHEMTVETPSDQGYQWNGFPDYYLPKCEQFAEKIASVPSPFYPGGTYVDPERQDVAEKLGRATHHCR